MKVLYPRCGGLDVHKEFVVACVLICEEDGQAKKEIRRFLFSSFHPSYLMSFIFATQHAEEG